MNIFQIILFPFTILITKVLETSFIISGDYGISLILVSFFITLITAPLYLLADKWKAEEVSLKNKMAFSLESINANYSGSKKFYLTKTLQKIWGYTSLHSFKTSFGLILQIPFFFGAYEALSHFNAFEGISFLFINDLSLSDSLFFGLPFLPFLMTFLNIISSAYYTGTFSLQKNKSLYIMAAVFLLLLYKSPSALLVYWSFNNIFSILKIFVLKQFGLFKPSESIVVSKKKVKQIDYKLLQIVAQFFVVFLFAAIASYFAYKREFLYFSIITFLIIILALASAIYIVFFKKQYRYLSAFIPCMLLALVISALYYISDGRSIFLSRMNFGLLVPLSFSFCFLLYPLSSLLTYLKKEKIIFKQKYTIFLLAFLSFFLFVYQPLAFYLSAPKDIGVSLSEVLSLSFLLFFIFLAIGTVLVNIFKKHKNLPAFFMLFLALIILFYSNVYKPNVGMINALTFQNPHEIEKMHLVRFLLDPIILAAFLFISVIIFKTQFKFFGYLAILFCFTLSGHLIFIYKNLDKAELKFEAVQRENNTKPTIPASAFENHVFSKTKKNVFFLIADMFNGNYLRRIVEEEPQYIEKLSGFIYYPDCLSISYATPTSLSAMWAGPDYLPHLLIDNGLTGSEELYAASESFFRKAKNAGYDITLSRTYFVSEKVKKENNLENVALYIDYWKEKNEYEEIKSNASYKNLPFLVSIFNASPWFLRNFIYDDAEWLLYRGKGKFSIFAEESLMDLAYFELLPEFSSVSDDADGLFLYYHNNLPHDPYGIDKDGKLVKDSYPEKSIPNFTNTKAAYYSAKKVISMLVNFTDWLKENEVYDNTMIIVVSDHGSPLGDSDAPLDFFKTPFTGAMEAGKSQSLFLVKDFNNKNNFIESKDLVSSSDITLYMESYGAYNGSKNYTLQKPIAFPPEDRFERYYSVIEGNWNGGLEIDSPKYTTYKVTGPLKEASSWEKLK